MWGVLSSRNLVCHARYIIWNFRTIWGVGGFDCFREILEFHYRSSFRLHRRPLPQLGSSSTAARSSRASRITDDIVLLGASSELTERPTRSEIWLAIARQKLLRIAANPYKSVRTAANPCSLEGQQPRLPQLHGPKPRTSSSRCPQARPRPSASSRSLRACMATASSSTARPATSSRARSCTSATTSASPPAV